MENTRRVLNFLHVPNGRVALRRLRLGHYAFVASTATYQDEKMSESPVVDVNITISHLVISGGISIGNIHEIFRRYMLATTYDIN